MYSYGGLSPANAVNLSKVKSIYEESCDEKQGVDNEE
jgi:hypothetical protein